MPRAVVSGGGGRALIDWEVVKELTAGLQKAVRGLPPPGPGVEWKHGVNVDIAATGPLLVLVAPNGSIQAVGAGAAKVSKVELRRRLTEARTAPPRPGLGIDEEGYVRFRGVRVLTARARSTLSPVDQAFALARSALGKNVPVVDVATVLVKESQPEGNFVCPDLTRSSYREMKVLEQTFGVQAVWTLDGSWRHIDKVGMVAASAAARHDGRVVGGRLEVDADGMPLNAYL
jgi:hypothetical protein